jgi:GSCFA family/Polysaccharide biosynthesis enzyme WcbI
MKIAIVSNCQGHTIAACLKDMNSSLTVEFFMISDLWGSGKTLNNILDEYDFILAQSSIKQYVPPSQVSKVIYFPDITFSAFHPDMTYLRGSKPGGEIEAIHSHMAHYNSALIVHGFVRGKSNEEIFASFNKDTFYRLGYLNRWESSTRLLIEQANEIGFDLSPYIEKWKKNGCFMYSFNHPPIFVLHDIALVLAKTLGITINNYNSHRYLVDPLKGTPIWPVYPDIAKVYELEGDYAFRCFTTEDILHLKEYIEASVLHYKNYDLKSIEPLNFNLDDYDKALSEAGFAQMATDEPAIRGAAFSGANPYKDLPRVQFWRNSVANVAPEDVDPVYLPRFSIDKTLKVATAGSCFAQHIARTLSTSGFNYFVTETPNDALTKDQALEKNYGVFSARYGNIYTARQFVQLFKRVSGNFKPVDKVWIRKDGRYVDPFRPQIDPAGYESIEELELSRTVHLDSVRKLFIETDVFVFTLGLTEGWRSKVDGAVFPLAPGVAGGSMDPELYEFVNFSVSEVTADMTEALVLLRSINGTCKVILTVSPVPLIATYETQHALVATTYSKAVLRVAADELKRKHDFVDYFPSFEIITGAFNKGAYFESDLRSVKPEGVAHVMRLFMKHYASGGSTGSFESGARDSFPEMKNVFGVVCDEEAIARL